MKPHAKIRKTVKWGGAVLTVLVLTLWLFTAWYQIILWGFGRCLVDARKGRITIAIEPLSNGGRTGWGAVIDGSSPELDWWFQPGSAGRLRWIWIPLWFPAVLCLLATGTAWRLDALARRRARIGKCVTCGYDRAGLTEDAACPECGKAKAAS